MNLEADWPGADVVFGVHHLRWIVSFDKDAASFFVGKLSSPQNRSTWVKIHTTYYMHLLCPSVNSRPLWLTFCQLDESVFFSGGVSVEWARDVLMLTV